MKRHTSATRTLLVAAAAGALVAGSAGGAVAQPAKAGGSKADQPVAAETKLRHVNIKRHRTLDLAKADATTALKLRASVRNSSRVSASEALPSFGISLGVFDKKVNGTLVEGTVASDPATVSLKERKRKRSLQRYSGDAVLASVWSPQALADLAESLEPGDKAYICIDDVTEDFDGYSRQARKRLDIDVKRPVRDCVKVIDSTPTP